MVINCRVVPSKLTPKNGATKCVQKLPAISARKPLGLVVANILKRHWKVSQNPIVVLVNFGQGNNLNAD